MRHIICPQDQKLIETGLIKFVYFLLNTKFLSLPKSGRVNLNSYLYLIICMNNIDCL